MVEFRMGNGFAISVELIMKDKWDIIRIKDKIEEGEEDLNISDDYLRI